jgi:hypothetical protein
MSLPREALRGEFGVEARARRRRARDLMKAARAWPVATCDLAGPESVPASAFGERVYETLCGRALPTAVYRFASEAALRSALQGSEIKELVRRYDEAIGAFSTRSRTTYTRVFESGA